MNTTDDTQPLEPVQVQEVTSAEMLTNLESTIKEHIASIDTSRSELKKLRDMLTGTFENDATYQEHDRLAKEAAKVRGKTKSELLKQPAAADLNIKAKEMSSDLKDLQSALSDYLREFQKLSGANEIEGDDGEVRDIVYSIKLIKRSKKFGR